MLWLALVVLTASVGCFERGQPAEHQANDNGLEHSRVPKGLAKDTAARKQTGPSAIDRIVDRSATIVARLEVEPPHLNPLISGDGLVLRLILGDVVEGLLCRDGPTSAVVPCLAERFESSADGKRWKFWLRENVRFHNGETLTV